MSKQGKHVKSPAASKYGAHAGEVRVGGNPMGIALGIMLAVAFVFSLFSLGRALAGLESEAFAGSARSAFFSLYDVGVDQPLASFGRYLDIAGEPLGQQDETGYPPSQRADYTARVGEKLQVSLMSGGCELVSLGIVLESEGLAADLDRITQDHLNVNGHFATGYTGDPYVKGGGYPAGIVAAANGYLEEIGADQRAYDLTGTPFEELEELVKQGYPVMAWSTMGLERPQFSGIFEAGMEWYDNEHCVVMYGFEGDSVLVSDPLDGLVRRDAAEFARVYEQCGRMAVVLC